MKTSSIVIMFSHVMTLHNNYELQQHCCWLPGRKVEVFTFMEEIVYKRSATQLTTKNKDLTNQIHAEKLHEVLREYKIQQQQLNGSFDLQTYHVLSSMLIAAIQSNMLILLKCKISPYQLPLNSCFVNPEVATCDQEL